MKKFLALLAVPIIGVLFATVAGARRKSPKTLYHPDGTMSPAGSI
ncbi:MAG: hypothetical protein AB4352_22985 [Hormoscilla sp.]